MIAIRHILCPVDLSPVSYRALEQAAALSRSLDAQLRVVRVLEIEHPGVSGLVAHEAIAELEQFVAPSRASGCDIEVGLAQGAPDAEILRAAEASSADLMVMGTHGRRGFERFVLGSVAERVLRKARCPVLAVPPADGQAAPHGVFQRVLCAIDFDPASLRGLDYARTLAADGASVCLIHTVEWPFGGEIEGMPAEIDALRRSLELDARQRLHRHTVAGSRPDLIWSEDVATGKPYGHILRQARDVSADLIVLGLHSHATSDLALLGSTARRVLHEAPCPVLTVSQKR
jgi:nucleotide-binding universal stress UspA family protein